MALIVEDGTGKADAEALATVAQYKTYLANRGITVSSQSDTDIEQMLRKASDKFAGYRGTWKGYRLKSTQALDWPRYGVTMRDIGAFTLDPNVIPTAIVNANILLAYKAFVADDHDLQPAIERVTLKEKVDVIEVEYAPDASVVTRYPDVEAIVSPYQKNGGSGAMVPLVRC